MNNKYDLNNLCTIVQDIRGEEYEFIDYFYDNTHKLFLNIKHKKCGNIFTVNAYNFLKKGTNCTECSKNKKMTKKEFEERIKNLSNNEYELIGDFNGVSKKVRLKHKICGTEFEMLAENFIQGQRCPNCNPHKNRGHNDFKKAFNEISKGEYTLLSEYKNSRSKILVQHNSCGYKYSIIANNFLSGHKCPKCFKGRHISEDYFKEKLNKLGFFNEHKLLSKYVGSKKKIKVQHLKCGTIFEITAEHLYRFPSACPNCKKSYGEKRIQKFLSENNIKFESEKKFDNCKDKYRLPFDFYIKSKNLLIEYDGEQHFRPVYGNKQFKITQKHDTIKTNFAKNNKYTLLRISYKDYDNIEEILKATFKL